MRRQLHLLLCFTFVLCASGSAPERAQAQQPIATTICSIWKEPDAFDGKIVQLRATVSRGFENFSIREPDKGCQRGMWLEYAREEDEKESSWNERGNALQKRRPVFLSKNESFSKFQDALRARVYPREEHTSCMGCTLYTVTAVMTGRVDYAGRTGPGFGHLNGARLQFTLASVGDISTVEQPYDWNKFSRTPIRFPHGTIQGTVTDSVGKPLQLAQVEAVSPTGKIPIINPDAVTKEDGSYSLDVMPGQYVLVVNRSHPATKNVPMDATYSPSAERRESAQIVTIADGQTVTDIDIHPLRALAEKHIRVHVVWPDGKPVDDANVDVTEVDKPYAIAGDEENGVSHTGNDGLVTLLAYAGRAYRLSADIYKKPGYVPYCEDVFLLPADFRDGLEITMVLKRQSETCRGQWNEAARPLPTASTK